VRDDVDAALGQLHLTGEALSEPAARDEDLARCREVRLEGGAAVTESAQHLATIPTREVGEQTGRAVTVLSVCRTAGPVLRRAEVARASDEVVVQGEDDGQALGESPDEVARERTVVMNVYEVDVSHGVVHALGEARARVLARRALARVSRDARSEESIKDPRDRCFV